MEQENEEQLARWDGYVDWRNRPALRGRHGGMLAASFVLVVEILENLAFLANASNLVMYLSEYMHLSPSVSANNVTNFTGTSFLLALLGGFLSDAFFTTYTIYLISAAIEFLLFHVLAGNEDLAIDLIYSQEVVQRNHLSSGSNPWPSKNQKNQNASPISPTHASQESKENAKEMAPGTETLTKSFSFLNRAVVKRQVHSSLECTVQQVEEVKVVIKILPIFSCTIMLTCCLAQLSTFSVQQAATMSTKLGSLKVPPASLPFFPVIFIMILAPIYDHFIIPFARKVTKSEMGITHLQRIGIGLVLSVIAMGVVALVEIKRKKVATNSGLLDSNDPLPITFFWIAFQYLFLGSADLFTLAGLMEFLFTEAPTSMRSLATSLSWASLAMGYYLSSVIVSIVNSITGNSTRRPWLSGDNINYYQLERFYWLMCVLSAVNFLHYLLWANWYKYRSTRSGWQSQFTHST
ncbi:protein NRT1/ PTR FAMILY 4.6-like [Manihot esculenta]|nr:protein NRT1/ PTR FAMILY 4.6-like [Manihot esculenta]